MADVLALARKYWPRLSESSAKSNTIVLIAPNGETAQTTNLGINNAITFETDGQSAIANIIHVRFSENSIIEDNSLYPIRDSDGEVALDAHRISYQDSRGITRQYSVKNFYPDETVGMIMCDLERYRP